MVLGGAASCRGPALVLPEFPVTPFLIAVGLVLVGVAFGVAFLGFVAGGFLPRLRFVAPLTLAGAACWPRSTGAAAGWPHVLFALAGLAVVLLRVQRPLRALALAPYPQAPWGELPPLFGSPWAFLRAPLLAAAAAYGCLQLGAGNTTPGLLGLLAVAAVAWTWEQARLEAPGSRPLGAAIRSGAMLLTIAALALGASPEPRVLEGLPETLQRLRELMLLRIAAAAALGAAAGLVVRAGRRGWGLAALAAASSFCAAAAVLAGPLHAQRSVLDRLTRDSVLFEPRGDWVETKGVPAPLRRFDRIGEPESVIVAPLLFRLGGYEDWCKERDVATARALASAIFGPSTLRVHRLDPNRDPGDRILQLGSPEDYYPCAFRADLESPTDPGVVEFRFSHCHGPRELVLLHVWTEDSGPDGDDDLTRFVRCPRKEGARAR